MNSEEAKMGIERKVREDVFSLFGKEKFKEGVNILQGLSFRLQEDDDTQLKRLVLRNLSFAFHKIGDMHMAKKYAKMIMKIADKDEKYKENNKKEFGDILNLFSEFCSDEISLKEKIKINKMNRHLYCNDIENLDKYYMAEANICILTENYSDIECIIGQIHNMEQTIIFNDEKKDMDMKCKLIHTKKDILKDLEFANPLIYKRTIEEIDSLCLSNTFTAM